MANQEKSREELERELQELRERLEIAEETLRAITQGEVDALVVSGTQGEQIFTLQSADYPYRRFVEEMKEGAATVNSEGMILYCNNRLMSWLKQPLDKIIGSEFKHYIAPQNQPMLPTLFEQAQPGGWKKELSLLATDGTEIPVQISISQLTMNDVNISGLIVTDLTEQKQNEDLIATQTAQLMQANTQLQQELQERQRAEQELELQAVVTRNMPGGICLIRATDWVIVYANPKFEQLFGYDSGELNGKPMSVLNYEDDHTIGLETTKQIIDEIETHGEVTYEVHNIKKDGTPFWCRATSSKFDHPEYGTVYVAVQHDITEQKQAEKLIKASLKEKEVLLKEIHHRVKNNLQIVTSFLQMQSRRTQEIQALEILRDSKNRIASIALVHEKLYRSENLANINFGQYIPDLTTHLFDTYNISSDTVKLKINVADISLPIDRAIPCGLIINELVSNSLKYAFPHNRHGKIQMDFYSNPDDTLTLTIQDNGIGIPEEFDIETTHSLGLTLVQGLVEQLEGTFELVRNRGTEFKITFPGGKL